MRLFSLIDELLQDVANIAVGISGNTFNPEGCRLPSFAPPKPPPTAKIPKKEGEKSKGGFWVGYDGQNMYDSGTNQIEMDDYASHGITEREYGEMLNYDPPLRSLELAGKVKAAKERGMSLAEFAKGRKESLSLIKHYSAALSRAKK